MSELNISEAYQKIIEEIQEYFKNAGFEKAVLGLSGGVDSAVVLKLAVDALGPKNVAVLLMPESGITSSENTMHARTLAKFLEVEYHTIKINPFLTNYVSLPWNPTTLAHINTKPRIRMSILYNYANAKGALVLGTSNKTEILLGYGTKYGDAASDLLPIGDLFKDEVYKMAEHLGLPDEFIQKTPSAELYQGQTDEEELGMTYREIDVILRKLLAGEEKNSLIAKGLNPNAIHKIYRLVGMNKHKSEPPHLIKVS